MNASVWALAIVGCLISIIGTLIILYLQTIKKSICTIGDRLDRQDTRIDLAFKSLADCKIDCDRNTVSKEDWVRSEGYTRQKIEQMTNAVMELNGKVKIIEQVPELVGKVTREIILQLKSGGFAND
jgi:hypothetical protein